MNKKIHNFYKLISIVYFFLILATNYNSKAMDHMNYYVYSDLYDFTTSINGQIEKRIVCVPVADLRNNIFNEDDKSRISQLLYGEYLISFHKKINSQTKETWIKVFCLEQRKYVWDKWSYVQGWVRKNQTTSIKKEFQSYNLVLGKQQTNIDFSIGTKLYGKQIEEDLFQVQLSDFENGIIESKHISRITPDIEELETLRYNLIQTAKSFQNTPYLSNGRSSGHYENSIIQKKRGIDSSGLIYLTYRAHSLSIPPNAEDQFFLCKQQNLLLESGMQLKRGDLIFFADKKNPSKITHVALYEYNEQSGSQLIEIFYGYNGCKITGTCTRLKTFIKNLKNGDPVGNYVIYFASYLRSKEFVKALRNEALRYFFPEFRNLSLTITKTNTKPGVK